MHLYIDIDTYTRKYAMASLKHSSHKSSSSSSSSSFSTPPTKSIFIVAIFLTSIYLFFATPRLFPEPFSSSDHQERFNGDLRNAKFPWNKLCFGPPPPTTKLKLAVFSKSWPILGAAPGGMERHAFTLYTALASKGHEIHVFTSPSDRYPKNSNNVITSTITSSSSSSSSDEIILHHHKQGSLHVYFASNDHGSLNCSLAFQIFNKINVSGDKVFDYVHTESVSLPHWRAKMVPNFVAVTWHGIWYEIMHSKLFQELMFPDTSKIGEIQEAMPRLIDEIKFFSSYTQHICISNSAGETLVNIYQIPPKNVHVILNGVDDTKFVHNPEAGALFRAKIGVPDENLSLVMGVAGRLVRDKGHPLLYEAFSSISKKYPNVYLVVAGSGPWGKRYAELGTNVKVLGALEAEELNDFYNGIDVFVNPTMRPQGLDLTLIEAMHCGKPVVCPNFPSVTGTIVVSDDFGYTFSPNVKSFVEALETVVQDGPGILRRKGLACKKRAVSMFTASKMASAYERFFLCMKNTRYCQYPLVTDC